MMKKNFKIAVIFFLTAMLMPVVGYSGTIEMVSVSNTGEAPNNASQGGILGSNISADGRFVAFFSGATNLVPNDTNGLPDIFVRDRENNTTERVSVSSDGAEGVPHPYIGFRHGATFPSISANGRFVAFISDSTNLVPDDTNKCGDVFVHDRETKKTERVSVTSAGAQGTCLGTITPGADSAVISANGRYVLFRASFPENGLVAGYTSDGPDLFLHDRETGSTELISEIDADTFFYKGEYSISADGRFIAYTLQNNVNGMILIYVYDREKGTRNIASVASDGSLPNNHFSMTPSMSDDGRFTAFSSFASNLSPTSNAGQGQLYLHDNETGATQMISVTADGIAGNNVSSYPDISPDGRYVTYVTRATNIAPADLSGGTKIVVYDRVKGVTSLVSAAIDGAQPNGPSDRPSISADGNSIAFSSNATNLVPGGSDGMAQVYVNDLFCGKY